jgi:lysine biosynthesis protein LysW
MEVRTMFTALDCPWCDATILVDDVDLDEGVRCDHCSVRFELAPAVPAELEAMRLPNAA